MRIIGLDIGDKRIGVSVSDEMLWTAQGVRTIQRTEINSDIREIKQIVEEYQATEIVAGMPINMDGTKGFKTYTVEKFIEKMTKFIELPVRYVDERLTTAQAHRSMLEGDLSRGKRKKRVDTIAAQLILQTHLDKIRLEKDE